MGITAFRRKRRLAAKRRQLQENVVVDTKPTEVKKVVETSEQKKVVEDKVENELNLDNEPSVRRSTTKRKKS